MALFCAFIFSLDFDARAAGARETGEGLRGHRGHGRPGAPAVPDFVALARRIRDS